MAAGRDRDPWEEYDHWRVGRIRAAGGVNKMLELRPVVLPAVLLGVGAVLLAVGLLLPDVPEDSSISWLSPVLMGAGGLCAALGLGGLFSALLVRIFGADAPTKGGKRPWV